jgi:hypothetical protein
MLRIIQLLSQQIGNSRSVEQWEELINLISQPATHTWNPINLQGEFNFREKQFGVAIVFGRNVSLRIQKADKL